MSSEDQRDPTPPEAVQVDAQPGVRACQAVAVIPARGGSKGIPGKNLKEVGGVPLLARSIRAARTARQVDQVCVSSDDPALLDLAEAEGAIAIPRPAELAGDTASSEVALLHALSVLRDRGIHPELLVFLQCTSPFTQSEHIDAVIAALQQSGAAMAFSAMPWHGFLWGLDPDGWGVGVNHEADLPRQRRQDLPPCWLETGAIYVMQTARFEAAGHRFIAPRLPVPLDGWAPEVDTPDDLEVCRRLADLLDGSTTV